MSTLTLTPLPPTPLRPAEYDLLVLRSNSAIAASRAAMRRYSTGKGTWDAVVAAQAEATRRYAATAQWWQGEPGIAYRAEVDAYENARALRKAERAAGAQASVNRRETAAVRSAACTRCFTTHPGEC